MKKIITVSLITTGGFLTPVQAAGRPNIVLFMVDDMGWQDTSVPFWSQRTPYNDLCHTPNMERLASQGVKFTNAYACAVSTPTRTSLMTGMNAARHRVTNWTLNYNTPTDAADTQLAFPSWNFNGLQPDGAQVPNSIAATTLAQILKENGYHTMHTGKGHWGARTTAGANPLNLGFEVNIAGSEIGGPASYYGQDNFGSGTFHVGGLEAYHGQDINLTEALTLETVKKLNERPAHKPFYLYLSHYTIHVPIQIDNRFKDNPKYAGMSGSELAYLTMIEGMDKSLGDLLDWLDSNGQADNTIVLFMSDNGGHHSVGNITFEGKQYRHQYPLRASKGSVYEGGVREPMIVKWPGVSQAGSATDIPVVIEDFFPSILEMAEVTDYTTSQTLDGISFVPVLKNEVTATSERALIWHFPNRWGETSDGSMAYSSVRVGDWKYIYRWHTGEMELYNLSEDIGEANNLLLENTESLNAKARQLSTVLSDYLRSVEAQRPSNRLNGRLIAWPDEAKLPGVPVEPQVSTTDTEHWYKIHDNRSPRYFWQIGSTGRLDVATEPIPNDTTTADKLFKIKLAPDGSGFQIFNRSMPDLPVASSSTEGNINLFAHNDYPVNSWLLVPSSAVRGYYHIAAEVDSRQLNSYHSSGFVSFWMPAGGDTDPGNRWAFLPGYLRESLKNYPEMMRFFTNATVPWEQAASRFLVSAKVLVNGEVQTLIETQANPTDASVVKAPNVVYPGAVVDTRAPRILIPKGVESFQLTCLGSTLNARNLQYTQQNVFVDWNNDFDFLDSNEAGERSNATASTLVHITAPGFTRSVAVPANTPPGVYRMRVIYHEPEGGAEWKSTIWNTTTIRNGIAYDFEVELLPDASTRRPEIFTPLLVKINNGRITVNDSLEFELFSCTGLRLDHQQQLQPGMYVVKYNGRAEKVLVVN